MDDLISRAAVIEALSTPCDKRYRYGVVKGYYAEWAHSADGERRDSE